MGNTCNSMADSCQCMTKPTQYCKVISLQLIKINEKKRKKNPESSYSFTQFIHFSDVCTSFLLQDEVLSSFISSTFFISSTLFLVDLLNPASTLLHPVDTRCETHTCGLHQQIRASSGFQSSSTRRSICRQGGD